VDPFVVADLAEQVGQRGWFLVFRGGGPLVISAGR
jgi:predicted Rossmann-fold nucleotide-binding protein